MRPDRAPTTVTAILTRWLPVSGECAFPTGNDAAKIYSVLVRRLGSVGVVGATKMVADSLEAQGVIPMAELNRVKFPRLRSVFSDGTDGQRVFYLGTLGQHAVCEFPEPA